MNPIDRTKRRSRPARLSAETLETRSLLTAGAGSMFAIIPGTITAVGQMAVVKFTIDPSHFTLPRGTFKLGIDVAADPSGTLKPLIAAINAPDGKPVRQAYHSAYDPTVLRHNTGSGAATSAVLTPISVNRKDPGAAVTYTVTVGGQGGTTGKFLLGFYLPGDANGDGVVDQSDVKLIKSELGAKGGSTRYTFDADANRDGRISATDLALARQNMGARTTINPTVSADLLAADSNGFQPRYTTKTAVHFRGTVTPNASVTYAEVNRLDPTVTTTADPLGHYNLAVAIAPGVNTYRVTTQDAFGQSITGTIAPVTRQAAGGAVTPGQVAALLAGKTPASTTS